MVPVSIRSPYRSKGRSQAVHAAETGKYVSIRSPYRSKGRSPNSQWGAGVQGVSIRSPYRSKGRLADVLCLAHRVIVSIRSPYRSKGRCLVPGPLLSKLRGFNPLPLPKQGEMLNDSSNDAILMTFQSAPLTEARGDATHREHHTAFPVSIRSPYRSKGRFNPFDPFSILPDVSIRSPYRSKGRLVDWRRGLCLPGRFNPLPLPKQGEIHSPAPDGSPLMCFNPLPLPKQGEIFSCNPVHAWFCMFQSAPLTEARGDPCHGRCRRWH